MSDPTQTRVGDVMTSPVETVSPSATVRAAAAQMRENNINSLLVTGSETGIVTSTDVLDSLAAGDDPDDVTVGDVMTAPVESVSADLRLGEAAAMMENFGFNHLPVRDGDRDIVGLISSTDLRATLA
ncbi:CBS domain-containing protein [Halorarius litoreus]|uniref:CBS domain-containing protein n=1 Tax=Halorarius litoreus TaxID=2962676 RepID=UPI0020CF30C1|nr:CBS domain-containing protein [Halorarius litoreus]